MSLARSSMVGSATIGDIFYRSFNQGCRSGKFVEGSGSDILSEYGSGSGSSSVPGHVHIHLRIRIHICVHIRKRTRVHILKHILIQYIYIYAVVGKLLS